MTDLKDRIGPPKRNLLQRLEDGTHPLEDALSNGYHLNDSGSDADSSYNEATEFLDSAFPMASPPDSPYLNDDDDEPKLMKRLSLPRPKSSQSPSRRKVPLLLRIQQDTSLLSRIQDGNNLHHTHSGIEGRDSDVDAVIDPENGQGAGAGPENVFEDYEVPPIERPAFVHQQPDATTPFQTTTPPTSIPTDATGINVVAPTQTDATVVVISNGSHQEAPSAKHPTSDQPHLDIVDEIRNSPPVHKESPPNSVIEETPSSKQPTSGQAHLDTVHEIRNTPPVHKEPPQNPVKEETPSSKQPTSGQAHLDTVHEIRNTPPVHNEPPQNPVKDMDSSPASLRNILRPILRQHASLRDRDSHTRIPSPEFRARAEIVLTDDVCSSFVAQMKAAQDQLKNRDNSTAAANGGLSSSQVETNDENWEVPGLSMTDTPVTENFRIPDFAGGSTTLLAPAVSASGPSTSCIQQASVESRPSSSSFSATGPPPSSGTTQVSATTGSPPSSAKPPQTASSTVGPPTSASVESVQGSTETRMSSPATSEAVGGPKEAFVVSVNPQPRQDFWRGEGKSPADFQNGVHEDGEQGRRTSHSSGKPTESRSDNDSMRSDRAASLDQGSRTLEFDDAAGQESRKKKMYPEENPEPHMPVDVETHHDAKKRVSRFDMKESPHRPDISQRSMSPSTSGPLRGVESQHASSNGRHLSLANSARHSPSPYIPENLPSQARRYSPCRRTSVSHRSISPRPPSRERDPYHPPPSKRQRRSEPLTRASLRRSRSPPPRSADDHTSHRSTSPERRHKVPSRYHDPDTRTGPSRRSPPPRPPHRRSDSVPSNSGDYEPPSFSHPSGTITSGFDGSKPSGQNYNIHNASTDTANSSASENPCHNVPGLWFVKVGNENLDMLDCEFDVDKETALKWNLPDPATSSAQDSWNQPKVSLQILCVPTSEVATFFNMLSAASISAQDFAIEVSKLQCQWPQTGNLIIQVNPTQSWAQTWLPPQLKAESPPVELNRCVRQGPNVVRFIQLTGMAEYVFVLFASEVTPSTSHGPLDLQTLLASLSRRRTEGIDSAVVTTLPMA